MTPTNTSARLAPGAGTAAVDTSILPLAATSAKPFRFNIGTCAESWDAKAGKWAHSNFALNAKQECARDVDEIAAKLGKIGGRFAWWSCNSFDGMRRLQDKWACASGAFADLDTEDHSPLTPEERETLHELRDTGKLPCNLWEDSPAGGHLVRVFADDCRDGDTLKAYLDEWCNELDATLQAAGLHRLKADRSLVKLNSLLFGPKAYVKGKQRDNELVVVSRELFDTPPMDAPTPAAPKPDALPPVPLAALPGNLGAYVAAEAANKETSPEMAFACALAVMSAAVPAGARSEWRGGWSEIAPLWLVVVAPSGDVKTPVLEALCKPMRDHDRALRVAFEQARGRHEIACAMHAEEMKRRSKGKAAAIGTPEPKPKPPLQPQTVMDSVTIEAMADVLNDNARFGYGCLWMSDEFVGRIMALNQYKGGKGDDAQAFLKLHPGSPVHVVRRTRRVFVDAPRISLIGTVQPKKLIELGRTDTEDGTFERLHFVAAGDPGAPRRHVPQVPEILRDEWRQRLRELLPPATADELLAAADCLPPSDADAAVLEFEPDAWEMFGDWHEANDKRTVRESWFRGYFSKSKGEALRLILTLHYWTHGPAEAAKRKATADTVRRALEIVEWLKAHTYRNRALMADGFTGTPEARPVLAYLRKNRARHIELRELVQNVRTCRDGVQRARELVQELADLGFAAWVDPNTVTLSEGGQDA